MLYQGEDIDYEEIVSLVVLYFPNAKLEAHLDIELFLMGVKTIFLNEKLDKENYI